MDERRKRYIGLYDHLGRRIHVQETKGWSSVTIYAFGRRYVYRKTGWAPALDLDVFVEG